MTLGVAVFLAMNYKHKGKMHTLDFIKIKNSSATKTTTQTVKEQPREWKNIFKLYIQGAFM